MSTIHRHGVCLLQKHACVFVFGRAVSLTATEVAFLHALMNRPGQIFSREKLTHHLPEHTSGKPVRVDAHIKRLRKKLFPDNKQAGRLFIRSEYGNGWYVPSRREMQAGH